MSERRDDALDNDADDALEASTVIERRKGDQVPGPVRLSPLQPLARVTTAALVATPPDPPPPPLLRPGSEPTRPLGDPRPTGSARRVRADQVAGTAARSSGGRRWLVVALGFAAGVLARDLWHRWATPPAPPVVALNAAPAAASASPVAPGRLVVPPPTEAAPVPPASPRAQKRKRVRGL